MFAALEAIVKDRQANPQAESYTNQLLAAGLPRMAQKVGEEGVEVAIAALAQDDAALVGEVADLIYHATVLLAARGLSWADVESLLAERNQSRTESQTKAEDQA